MMNNSDDLDRLPWLSRRGLLRRGSMLALAVPGLSLFLASCDRKSSDKSEKGNNGSDHGSGMSHGDAAGAGADMVTPQIAAQAPSAKLTRFDPQLPPPPADGVLNLNWKSTELALRISPNTVVPAWTFEDNIPGPLVHCRVGDTVNFTLTNTTLMPHSMDFHAARLDPKTAFRSVAMGQSHSYSFKPGRAGAFLYHCGVEPMLLHIGAGMFGALIVSPKDPLPPAREFVLVQSEYYLGAAVHGVQPFVFSKMLSVSPDMVAFNGRPDQYSRDPIRVKKGERVRFWVVNAGPTLPCSFHVVGEQFETVYLGEPPASAIHGVQTWAVPAGGGMGFDLMCDNAGEFPFVNHAMGHGQKGAMGLLVVE
ncbi:MAG: multicopper oxidase domain-containing protein [Phycisphaerales bacterium]|nr:multicopper oxidase domain-containing protein [Phycisphaerales bacterium]